MSQPNDTNASTEATQRERPKGCTCRYPTEIYKTFTGHGVSCPIEWDAKKTITEVAYTDKPELEQLGPSPLEQMFDLFLLFNRTEALRFQYLLYRRDEG